MEKYFGLIKLDESKLQTLKKTYITYLVYVILSFAPKTLTMYNMQFGDHDGTGSEVLLQHPLGVCSAKDGLIYITDSYNHKVIS